MLGKIQILSVWERFQFLLRSSLKVEYHSLFNLSKSLKIPLYIKSYWFNQPLINLELTDLALGQLSNNRNLILVSDSSGIKINDGFLKFLLSQINKGSNLIMLDGNLSGLDERIHGLHKTFKVSLGDFTISNGWPLFYVVVDYLDRQLYSKAKKLIFVEGVGLKQYGRPRIYKNLEVPDWFRRGDPKLIESKIGNLDLFTDEVNSGRISD